MQLACVGLNHTTAPVEIRECLAVADDRMEATYQQLLANDRVYETLIISTCNRVEYYIVTDSFLCTPETVIGLVAAESGIIADELKDYTYVHCGLDAVKHLFRVASGLDSLVLGEPQIFGQVKDAFGYARRWGQVDTFLKKLEESTFKIAKKVRTHTGIGDNPVSISYAAVELAKKIFGELSASQAMIIGAGEMCEIAAKHLAGNGIGGITVTNRTFAKAESLAEEVGGCALAFDRFPEYLKDVDIVISSTGADHYVVTADMVKAAMAERKHTPMFFIDIAVPRDIDPEADKISNVYVYDIDDLKAVVEANRKQREKEAKKAMEYIDQAVGQFENWIESLHIVPVIKELRMYFDNKKQIELDRFCDKFKVTDEEERDKLAYLLTAYMNKLLHEPLGNLKEHGNEKKGQTVADTVRVLFNIEE